MSTSRQPLPPSTHAPPNSASVASSSNNHRANYPDLLGTPQIPPRSSSYKGHHGSNAASAASSSEKVSGSRHAKAKADGRNASRREKAADDVNGGSRSCREDPSRGAGRSNTRGQPASAGNHRQGTIMETIPGQGTLVKESSTVINQVVVSDPSVDIEREKVRQAGAPTPSPTSKAPSSGLALVGEDGVDDGGRGGMRNHDYNGNSSRRKETSFGQFILGQTLGEGEFGKVKLGWKKDGSIQVAIKLIRREILGSNPSRLPKIYREISILRDLRHPNIVRLHEMVETDRHIGIIMEYASGGELFDHILSNRYLKDNAARRLFAQLVSGVGYLHKKGIVHRDLKLENLLLDRNRNIIITDFGFANTFDPGDELDEEIEYNLTNKEYVKRMRLDKPNSAGLKRGDLMQTSCGSPCYAAPELVVSDSLYTGRKVDVWSCGVILYAMLAGYLPFDDDPANPDGDNINLLYKYIVTTPLTFPEYVTPHARDLLRRILVPDPRQRADLFEVARHSWLSEYSHVVSHITSSTTKVQDIASATLPLEQKEGPSLARSASVREPPKSYNNPVPTVGGLSHQSGDISQEQHAEKAKTPRDAKRRTVQVEYVAPQSQTTRGETGLQGAAAPNTEPMATPQEEPAGGYRARDSKPASDTAEKSARSNSDAAAFPAPLATAPQNARPTTGGSMGSFNAGRLPSRGSYGQPVAPTVATTNAEGRLAQPKSNQHVISGPMPQDPSQAPDADIGRPSIQQLPSKFNTTPRQGPPKGHKRSNTVSGIGEKLFGRSGSIFGGRTAQPSGTHAKPDAKPGKRYPPTSMKGPVAGDEARGSIDSRRSVQYGSNRRPIGAEARPRRFSLLPPSFSLRSFSASNRAQTPDEESQAGRHVDTRFQQRPSTAVSRPRPRATTYGTQDHMAMVSEGPSEEPIVHEEPAGHHPHTVHGAQANYYQDTPYSASAERVYSKDQSQYTHHPHANQSVPNYYGEYGGAYDNPAQSSMQVSRPGRPGALQKNRKFADAYEYERDAGSSGAARKVMDFFRRRAKSRAGDER